MTGLLDRPSLSRFAPGPRSSGAVKKWVHAKDLRSGMWLRTSAGTHVQVETIEGRTAHAQRVHNLTIADTHTHHALAGSTPVLVHNCGDGSDPLITYADSLRPGATKRGPHVAAEYTSPSGRTYYGHNGHGQSPMPGGDLEGAMQQVGHHGG
ncbi:polymorphic toxin-type HINT domain-containing protein [Thermomonospora umbrina]|uniref:polymorphic toxin-type HINT domain-containing protein n=1 Tax=Thermomonospora umbrina TaxID=111806 RepID=UPI0011C1CF93